MLLLNSIIFIILLTIAKKDYQTYTIPNTYLCCLVPFILLHYLLSRAYLSGFCAFLLGGGLFLTIYLLTGSLGAGDVKFVMVISWWLGMPSIISFLYLSILTATLWALISCCIHRTLKRPIPFAPSMVLAAVLSFYRGEDLLNCWLKLMM